MGGRLSTSLKERLLKTREVAAKNPAAKIIVSGGPVAGAAEGPLMRRWLVAHGISASRIEVEDKARYTLDNVRKVMPILREMKPTDVVVVTSASHMARAFALLDEEIHRTQARRVRMHKAPAREVGTGEAVSARKAAERVKLSRDLETQRRERRTARTP